MNEDKFYKHAHTMSNCILQALTTITVIILVLLKIFNVIDWHWLVVLLPLWAYFIHYAIMLISGLIVGWMYRNEIKDKK